MDKTNTDNTNVPKNQILCGNCVEITKTLPSDSVDVIVTSSPYWGLRDYGAQNVVIWSGKANCQHQWGEQIIEHQRGSIQGETCKVGNQIKGVQKTEVDQGSFCQLCGAWRGQLGLEPYPSMFIEHLVEIFREAKRALKPSGSCWVVLGDSYFGDGGTWGKDPEHKDLHRFGSYPNGEFNKTVNRLRSNWLQPKQKMLIPERFAIAMQEDGWILRNTVIWHKINHMPSSVRDRLTNAYESVFFFVKNSTPLWYVNSNTGLSANRLPIVPMEGVDFEWVEKERNGKTELVKESFWSSYDYYFDLDAIRKILQPSTITRVQSPYKSKAKFIETNLSNIKAQAYADKINNALEKYDKNNPHKMRDTPEDYEAANPDRPMDLSHPFGANPGDCWSLTSEGFKGQHFATFPQKLIRRILEVSAPKQICNKCGRPRTRITISELNGAKRSHRKIAEVNKVSETSCFRTNQTPIVQTVGWSDCGCGAGFHSAIVYDPFCGSGTTLLVSHKMGLDWFGSDLNPEYCKIAENRITEHGKFRLDEYIENP